MEEISVNRVDGADGAPDNVADVSDHIRGVLEAAERAAAHTVEQARAEGEKRVGAALQRAQELVEERKGRIREITDDLLGQADAIEERLAKLDEQLGTAIESLRRELERLPEPPSDDEVPAEEDLEPARS